MENNNEDSLSIGKIICYSLPNFGIYLVLMTVIIYLPNFYTDHLGVAAGLIGWIFLAGRLWDAVSDPVMGYISDRTQTKMGRRRPYFLIGMPGMWALFYLIWSPNPSLSAEYNFIYVFACYLLLYTFWTIYCVPYVSMAMELTPNHHERSRLFGIRQAIGILGILAGAVTPVLFIKFTGSTFTGYSLMAFVYGGIFALFTLVMFFTIKENVQTEQVKIPFFEGFRITFKNRAFVLLALAYLVSTFGLNIGPPLAMYIAKYLVKLEWIVQVGMLLYLTCSFLSIPVWVILSRKFGKKKTWIASMFLAAIGYGIFVTLAEGTWLRYLMVQVPAGMAWGCTLSIGYSILADIIDSDELETDTRREGGFVGVWSFCEKAAIGLAGFIALQGLQLFGFVPNVEQSNTFIIGVKVIVGILPVVCCILAAIIFWKFPITKAAHDQIRIQIEERRNSRIADSYGN